MGTDFEPTVYCFSLCERMAPLLGSITALTHVTTQQYRALKHESRTGPRCLSLSHKLVALRVRGATGRSLTCLLSKVTILRAVVNR
jgi:hypothetical protein